MKRPLLALLLAAIAVPGCQTAHRAAVSTFRVIDAPHEYLRRKLDVEEDDRDRTETRTTTTTETDVPSNPNYPQPYQEQGPPPQVVTAPPPQIPPQREPSFQANPPPPPPRVTSRTTTESSQTRETESKNSASSGLPYAKPVPGKPGYVYSPFDKNGGYVDVTGFAPGSKVKDPYSGKIFLVP